MKEYGAELSELSFWSLEGAGQPFWLPITSAMPALHLPSVGNCQSLKQDHRMHVL